VAEIEDGELYPDGVTYSTLIDAWSMDSIPNAGQRAEGVFREIWKRGHQPWAKSDDPNATQTY